MPNPLNLCEGKKKGLHHARRDNINTKRVERESLDPRKNLIQKNWRKKKKTNEREKANTSDIYSK